MWTKEPERFSVDPTHQFPGLNNYIADIADVSR
jgi:hypothetical protein